MRLWTKSLWVLCATIFALGAGVAILGCYYMQPSFRSIVESKSTVAALHFDVTMPARRINSQWNPQSRTASNAPDGRLIVVHWASIKTTAPSVVRHSDATLSSVRRARVTFSRMSEALAVQMNGFGDWL